MTWTITHTMGQIELRKAFREGNLLVIISDGSWKYKEEKLNSSDRHRNTKGYDVRISMNGPIWLTFNDWDNIKKMIDDQIDFLIKGKSKKD